MATSLELDVFAHMFHNRNTFYGSYSDIIVQFILAPLGTLAPPVFNTTAIALWLIGFSWLTHHALTLLRIERHRRGLYLMVSSLIVVATINAFFSDQSLYWYNASLRYTLPLAMLTIILALVIIAVPWMRTHSRARIAAIVFALLFFINAGFSEMYMVFQLLLLSFLPIVFYGLVERPQRRPYLMLVGAGWTATLCSLFVQLSASGVSLRALRTSYSDDVHYLDWRLLFSKTFSSTFQMITDPEIFAGTVLLLSVGLLLALSMTQKIKPSNSACSLQLSQPPLLLGLFVQLLCIPLLWDHTSDYQQLLGRFSIGYATVLAINASLVTSLFVLLFIRIPINSFFRRRNASWLLVPALILPIIVALFAMTQFRSIHWRASTYLYITGQLLLWMLYQQLSRLLLGQTARRFSFILIWSYAIAWISTAAIAFLAIGAFGQTILRVHTFSSFFLLIPGLIWGVFLGQAISNIAGAADINNAVLTAIKLGSIIALLAIGTGIVLENLTLMPSFQRHARELG